MGNPQKDALRSVGVQAQAAVCRVAASCSWTAPASLITSLEPRKPKTCIRTSKAALRSFHPEGEYEKQELQGLVWVVSVLLDETLELVPERSSTQQQ